MFASLLCSALHFTKMGGEIFSLLSLILSSSLVGGVCPPGLVESVLCRGGSCDDCVTPWTLLLGGSYNSLLQIQWRRDIEIWTEDGPLDRHLPDFPYSLDHPFAWWSSALQSVLVCGGKNWDDDESSSQCWRWLHCQGVWRHELDLPLGIHGGASVRSLGARGEELWLVGGGNGTAFSHVFVGFSSARRAAMLSLLFVETEPGGREVGGQ